MHFDFVPLVCALSEIQRSQLMHVRFLSSKQVGGVWL
jgi:hypothetical protein